MQFEEKPLSEIEPGSVVELPAQWQHVYRTEHGVWEGGYYFDTYGDKSSMAFTPTIQIPRYNTQALQPYTLANHKVNEKWKVMIGHELGKKYQDLLEKRTLRLGVLSSMSGTDPEVFVLKGDGNLFPAWEFLPKKTQGNQMAYWDGFQAECKPQARYCLQEVHDRIRNGLLKILGEAQARDKEAKLTLVNTMMVDQETLATADEEHVQFGCSPSLNVYDDNPPGVPNGRLFPYRFAGGHLHAGLPKLEEKLARKIVKACDGILGVACVGMAAGIDDPIRRRIYGRAGEFRLPKHGVEYRVLSNFWLCHPAVSMLVFEIFRVAIRMGMYGVYEKLWEAKEDEIRKVINECDVNGARDIIKRNKLTFEWIIKQAAGLDSYKSYVEDPSMVRMTDTAYRLVMEGVGCKISDPTNIEKNWMLKHNPYNGYGWGSNCSTNKKYWASLGTTAPFVKD